MVNKHSNRHDDYVLGMAALKLGQRSLTQFDRLLLRLVELVQNYFLKKKEGETDRGNIRNAH